MLYSREAKLHSKFIANIVVFYCKKIIASSSSKT